MSLLCFFEWSSHHRDLHVLHHAFPTRRSSDLRAERLGPLCTKSADKRSGILAAAELAVIVGAACFEIPWQIVVGIAVAVSAHHPDFLAAQTLAERGDRKSVVWGTSVTVRVDLGGRRILTPKSTGNTHMYARTPKTNMQSATTES